MRASDQETIHVLPPNLRREIRLAAESASVPIDNLDRAGILERIATLLVAHRHIRNEIAFRSGTTMHLVTVSPAAVQ